MTFHLQDAVVFMQGLDDSSVNLLWTDPPFGTGNIQSHHSTWVGSPKYGYKDTGEAAALQLLDRVAVETERVLTDDGVAVFLLDYRIVHEFVLQTKQYLKFEREIIYHFELGATTRNWWTNKHNTMVMFSKGNPKFYLDRVPMTKRKSGRGAYDSDERRVNSVWTYTFGPSDRERVGYPNQKPLAIVEPFVKVHTDEGDMCIDPFAGSGTLAVAAQRHNRRWAVADTNPQAEQVTNRRTTHEDHR